jgi:hypothetical protein
MSCYVLVFRGEADRQAAPADEAAWASWFRDLGGAVTDFGNRVGRAVVVRGNGARGEASDVLTGYVVVSADSLQAAVDLAGGCPGLASGGRVEVGEVVAL